MIALRSDLANDLRRWLSDKLAAVQIEARDADRPVPFALSADALVFAVPDKLCKILNRDLRLAGIAKCDERGRVLDVHALRHTFGTLLSKGGVMPRTAQAAMRHSKIELTMNVYTDPKLLDVHGALEALPELSLDTARKDISDAVKATGTTGMPLSQFARQFAVNPCKPMQTGSILDNGLSIGSANDHDVTLAISACGDKQKHPPTSAVSGCLEVGATGLEPVTPSVSSWCSSQLS